MKAKSVVFPDPYPDKAEPGTYDLNTPGRMILACPGCGKVAGMEIGNPKPNRSPSWLIDITTMTLSPSINCKGCCGWHGYLRNGVFELC